MTCGIIVPLPMIKPASSALEACSLNHKITKELYIPNNYESRIRSLAENKVSLCKLAEKQSIQFEGIID